MCSELCSKEVGVPVAENGRTFEICLLRRDRNT